MQKMHPCSCIASFGAESQPNEFHFHATSSMVPAWSANRHHSNQTAHIWSTVEIHTDWAPTCTTKALLCEAYVAVTVINRRKLLQLKFWHPKKNISINSVVGRWCFTDIFVETPVFTVTKTPNWNLWAFRSISNERSSLCSSHLWMSINLFLLWPVDEIFQIFLDGFNSIMGKLLNYWNCDGDWAQKNFTWFSTGRITPILLPRLEFTKPLSATFCCSDVLPLELAN